MEKEIYLDNAATTKVIPEVLNAMLPYFVDNYGNANSLHEKGIIANEAIIHAREQVAALINADPEQIIFTSGATEGNNWVINEYNGCVLTSEIEHPSMINPLITRGIKSFIDVKTAGVINLESLKNKLFLTYQVPLVSVMFANNETGVIQPWEDIVKIAKEFGSPTHCDATQAVGHVALDVKTMDVYYLTGSGHKFGAPQGIGFIYVKEPDKIKPYIIGGHQQNGLRGGTLNVPSIVGIGAAAEYAKDHLYELQYKLSRRRSYLEDKIINEIPNASVNGQGMRLPGHSNISFPCDGHKLLMWLSEHGIYVSSGSACSNGERSYVLKAMGLSPEQIDSSIRFSLGSDITQQDIDYVVQMVKMGIDILQE